MDSENMKITSISLIPDSEVPLRNFPPQWVFEAEEGVIDEFSVVDGLGLPESPCLCRGIQNPFAKAGVFQSIGGIFPALLAVEQQYAYTFAQAEFENRVCNGHSGWWVS